MNEGNMEIIWEKVNFLLRIPKYPNVVPIDCRGLVVDTVDGQDK